MFSTDIYFNNVAMFNFVSCPTRTSIFNTDKNERNKVKKQNVLIFQKDKSSLLSDVDHFQQFIFSNDLIRKFKTQEENVQLKKQKQKNRSQTTGQTFFLSHKSRVLFGKQRRDKLMKWKQKRKKWCKNGAFIHKKYKSRSRYASQRPRIGGKFISNKKMTY